MTAEQFARYRFQHSEIIIFHQRHPEADVEMMLVGIDFDMQMLKLVPLNLEWYEDEAVWIPIDRCDRPEKTKMKIIKIR